MANLEDTINQAIADFDEIENAIEEMGIDVPAGTDTKEYGSLIRKIPSGGITVDQSYNGESENPQSGIAVDEALKTLPIKYVVSPDENDNIIYLRSLESGTYVLQGAFKPYEGNGTICRFSSNLLVNVVKGTLNGVGTSHIQIFYPVHNVVQFVDVTDSSYKRTDIKLNELAYTSTVEEMIAVATKAEQEIYGNALKATASGEVIRVDDVSPIEHTAKAKVYGKNLLNVDKMVNDAFVKNADGSYTFTKQGVNRFTNETPITLKAGITYYWSATFTDVSVEATTISPIWKTKSGKEYYSGMLFDGQGRTIMFSEDVVSILFYLQGSEADGSSFTFKEMQITESDTATEYEPYLDPTTVTVTRYGVDESDNMQTYTPKADGTLDIVSVSPTMTLLTDTAGVNIEVEYNQDNNKAMDNVKEDIRTLDNGVAELSGVISDIETSLDNVIEKYELGGDV